MEYVLNTTPFNLESRVVHNVTGQAEFEHHTTGCTLTWMLSNVIVSLRISPHSPANTNEC
jgi:hypothetical protein